MSLPTLTFRTVTYCTDARCTEMGTCWRAAHERYGDATGENYGPRCTPVPMTRLSENAILRSQLAELEVSLQAIKEENMMLRDVQREVDDLRLQRAENIIDNMHAYEEGVAEGERRATAAVVAWLRGKGNDPSTFMSEAIALTCAASVIECGDHRREEER